MKMTIETKAGQMTIEVSGTKQNPIAKFVGGPLDGLNAKPQHWSHKGLKPGIFVEKKRAYIQNERAHEELKNVLANLPKEKEIIRKVEREVFADGEKATVKEFNIGPCFDDDGNVIPASEILAMLDEKCIAEIEKQEAVDMWVTERKAAYIEKESGFNFHETWGRSSDGTDK